MDNTNNPFSEYMKDDNETALQEFKAFVGGMEKRLLLDGLKILGMPQEVMVIFEKLIENGCPPIAIVKTLSQLTPEDFKDDE